jgi:hypothetical protein
MCGSSAVDERERWLNVVQVQVPVYHIYMYIAIEVLVLVLVLRICELNKNSTKKITTVIIISNRAPDAIMRVRFPAILLRLAVRA